MACRAGDPRLAIPAGGGRDETSVGDESRKGYARGEGVAREALKHPEQSHECCRSHKDLQDGIKAAAVSDSVSDGEGNAQKCRELEERTVRT